MVNFAEAAQKKMGEIERPALPPLGEYRWRITKVPEHTKQDNGPYEFLTINCQVVEPLTADMSDYKGDPTGIFNRVQFIFNTEDEAGFERTLFQAKNFFENHAKCCSDTDTLLEAINNAQGHEFVGTISWRPDKTDPEIQYANITKTAPVD